MAVLLSWKLVRIALAVVTSVGVGLAVIVSTYYVDNYKLVIGLVGGIAFVLLTMRWPEFGILSYVALLSGIVHPGYLPLFRLGPVSLNIGDLVLSMLLGLVFLRVTTRRGFTFIGSPLMLPMLLFLGAALLGAANSVLIHHVGVNTVLRTLRVLAIWLVFVPALQLVRDEKALRRLLIGMVMLALALLIGVLFPNRLSPLLPVEETDYGTAGQVYAGLTRIYYRGDMILYAMIPVTVASLALVRSGNQLWRVGMLAVGIFWAFRTGYRQYWLTLVIVCAMLLAFVSTEDRLRLIRRLAPATIVGMIAFAVLMTTQPSQVERISYVMSDRLGSLLKDPFTREQSLQWRAIENRYALLQIRKEPLLGVGLANRYRPPMISETDLNSYGDWTSKFVENGYLWIALMMGLVGLLPFLWLCATYLIRIFRNYREISDHTLRAVYLGCGLAFVGIAACNMATPFFVIGERLVFFPVSMAISETILRVQRANNARL